MSVVNECSLIKTIQRLHIKYLIIAAWKSKIIINGLFYEKNKKHFNLQLSSRENKVKTVEWVTQKGKRRKSEKSQKEVETVEQMDDGNQRQSSGVSQIINVTASAPGF